MERSEKLDLTADTRPVPIPPGRQLRRAREARNLGIADVAATLRLSVATIDNLEQDRYDRLPPDTFVRGYLRAYGRILQLDAESLVQAFYDSNGGPVPRPLRASKPVQTAPDLSLGMKYMLPAALAAGMLVFAAIWGVELYRGLGQSDGSGHAALESVGYVNERLDRLLERTDPDAPVRRGGDVSPEDVSTGARTAGSVVDDGPSNAGQVTEPSAVSESSAPPFPVRIAALDRELAQRAEGREDAATRVDEPDEVGAMDAQSENGTSLVMRFNGLFWVEVRDSDGERLLYGLIQYPETHRLDGTPPFFLVIGDVGQVSVELNGEAVDLGDQRPGRVARLSVPSD